MLHFRDKVAVITGAASGTGRALAERCAQEGMKVVLGDIDQKSLSQTKEEMKAAGATVLDVLTDVSKISDIEALAQKTLDAFGAVHLLCNNAGVITVDDLVRPIWESTLADWEWVLNVNLWGVIHGVRVFTPIMLEQDTDCHIINTASMGGFISGPISGIYGVSKHGVVTLSETLHYNLAQQGTKVKVSVLCPGLVDTRIVDAALKRVGELKNDSMAGEVSPEDEQKIQALRRPLQEGMSPTQVVDCLFNGIREGKFYILTHPERKENIQTRMENILQERNPTIPT